MNWAFNSEYVGQGILFIQSYLYSEIIHVCLKFLRFFHEKKCLNLKSFTEKSRKTIKSRIIKGHIRGDTLVSGSCHLDRALSVEIGVECQIFLTAAKFYNLGHIQR